MILSVQKFGDTNVRSGSLFLAMASVEQMQDEKASAKGLVCLSLPCSLLLHCLFNL